MVFYIHDQGRRVQTPIDQLLLRPLRVTPTQRVALISSQRVGAISGEAAQYQQIAEQRERQAVVMAADIMHRPVISIASTALIDEAWSLFALHRIHHLPVLDAGRLLGMVSDRDLLRASLNRGAQLRIDDIMSQPVITAAPETEIRLLAEVMVRQRIGALPVVVERDDVETVVGVVTRSDLLRLMVDRGPLELWV